MIRAYGLHVIHKRGGSSPNVKLELSNFYIPTRQIIIHYYVPLICIYIYMFTGIICLNIEYSKYNSLMFSYVTKKQNNMSIFMLQKFITRIKTIFYLIFNIMLYPF